MARQLVADEGEISFDSLEKVPLTRELEAEYAPLGTFSVPFGVGRTTLEVRFSNPQSAAAFAGRYRDLATTGPGDFIIYAIERGEEALFWAAGSRRVWRWNGGALPADLCAFFADSAALYEFLCGSRYFGFHAAVLAGSSTVAALVGETTAGKTTTALACVRRGLALYSDERCILEDGLVVPFPRRMTLRPGGRAALLADPVPDPRGLDERLAEWQHLDEVAIRPSTLFGAQAQPARRLGAVFVIEGRGAEPAVHRSSAGEAMPALLKAMASRESGLDRIARLLGELRDVRVFRMNLGSPDASARAIAAEMQNVELCSTPPN